MTTVWFIRVETVLIACALVLAVKPSRDFLVRILCWASLRRDPMFAQVRHELWRMVWTGRLGGETFPSAETDAVFWRSVRKVFGGKS